MTDEKKDPKDRSFVETIEVTGSQLIERVRGLLREGNVRHLRFHAKDSDFSLELPMTLGVVAGGAVVLAAPWLAILGVVAALVAKVEIEVERGPETTAPPAHPEAAASSATPGEPKAPTGTDKAP